MQRNPIFTEDKITPLAGSGMIPSTRLRVPVAAPNSTVNGGTMLVVRNCFIAKPGNASKLAAQLKEAAAASKIPRHRILTDLTGEFNRVILEYEAEDLAQFEATMKDYANNETFRAKMKGYTDFWITGSREILQVA